MPRSKAPAIFARTELFMTPVPLGGGGGSLAVQGAKEKDSSSSDGGIFVFVLADLSVLPSSAWDPGKIKGVRDVWCFAADFKGIAS